MPGAMASGDPHQHTKQGPQADGIKDDRKIIGRERVIKEQRRRQKERETNFNGIDKIAADADQRPNINDVPRFRRVKVGNIKYQPWQGMRRDKQCGKPPGGCRFFLVIMLHRDDFLCCVPGHATHRSLL